LLQNPQLCRQLGDNARARVCCEFSWDYSAGRLRKLLGRFDNISSTTAEARSACDAPSVQNLR
jgi:hypothetical protein